MVGLRTFISNNSHSWTVVTDITETNNIHRVLCVSAMIIDSSCVRVCLARLLAWWSCSSHSTHSKQRTSQLFHLVRRKCSWISQWQERRRTGTGIMWSTLLARLATYRATMWVQWVWDQLQCRSWWAGRCQDSATTINWVPRTRMKRCRNLRN